MANKRNNGEQRDRRATLEAMRREQKSSERRKNLMVVGGAGVLGLGLIAAVGIPTYLDYRDDPANRAVASYGVDAAAASCDEPVIEPATGVQEHVADGTTVTYGANPPAFGAHYAVPATFERSFYTPEDRPPVEQLVHNLEHGYTVLWYDPELAEADRSALSDLASSVREKMSDQVAGTKFIVAPWDAGTAEVAEGKRYVLAHWGAQQGARQACGDLSGAVVEDFVEAHPYTDSPEPNGI
ncbi:DUF3105 domain-containing protein [Vallicoccus soli]|uniref:DUF3105 domain-containing protein n=1 Tax=Vallicoccus soli TaxID=2339232 RepID=A0A3A3YV10_9ACTN|nr:DUF3105 domain-containing protein [Vallicoccus soli]RJK95371.1 DUF3105 domain-containing protein [Vallicoccus soli]